MQKNLTTKTIIIAVTLLICIYGIIGIPKSKAELMANLEHNIRLGLDLRGGSHLILQVQVQDALKAEADNVIERMKEEARRSNVDYASLDRNDPMRIEDGDSIQVNIKGVPAQKTGAFRSMVADRFPAWVLTPVNASDYRMNLKPSELLLLKRETVERSIQTIGNRINNLGLTEPDVRQHGRADAEFEILVQLPGVDDPG
ncbi:MAG: protein translocase subunit SecD, partial [Bryobacteraceae bacterium]